MKKAAQKLASFAKKHKFISITIGLVVILLGWWMTVSFMPHPLGSGLTYLGRQDYGGPFGDSTPYSIYYYGTDMNQSEIVSYFKKMKVAFPSEKTGTYIQMWFKEPSTSQTVELYYYNSSSVDGHHTIKSHVIKLRSDDYATIQASL